MSNVPSLSVSVLRLAPVHVRALSSPWIPTRNSAFCIRRLLWCFCVSPYCPHDVLSLSVHLNAFSPRRSCDTATVMQKERDERLMTPLAGGKAVFLRPGPDLWRISLCRRPPGIQATALSHSTCYVRRRRADAPCKMYFSAGYVLEGAAEAGQPIKLSYWIFRSWRQESVKIISEGETRILAFHPRLFFCGRSLASLASWAQSKILVRPCQEW